MRAIRFVILGTARIPGRVLLGMLLCAIAAVVCFALVQIQLSHRLQDRAVWMVFALRVGTVLLVGAAMIPVMFAIVRSGQARAAARQTRLDRRRERSESVAHRRLRGEIFARITLPLIVVGTMGVAGIAALDVKRFPEKRNWIAFALRYRHGPVTYLWYPLVGGLLWLNHHLAKRYRHRHPPEPNSDPCPQCGYDRRASPERCPECGMLRSALEPLEPPEPPEPPPEPLGSVMSKKWRAVNPRRKQLKR